MSINPDTRDRPVSVYAEQMAGRMSELRGEIRPLMLRLRPMLQEMAREKGRAPMIMVPGRRWKDHVLRLPHLAEAIAPDEMLAAIEEWLSGSDDRAADEDLQAFDEDTK